jgi:hypothetical protein
MGKLHIARTSRLILAASLVALSAAGVLVVHLLDVSRRADGGDSTGAVERGESVVAKLPPDRGSSINQPAEVPVHEPAKVPPPVQTPEQPKLEGLTEIPPSLQAERKPGGSEPLQHKSAEEEVLPWDLVEPVPLSTSGTEAPANADAASSSSIDPETNLNATTPVPSPPTVERWVRASATELKGSDRSRAIYHFDFWLDAPEEVRQQLASVAYEFNTPAVMPQSQISRESSSGFRVSAGGLTCADEVTVTLTFKNDQSERVTVDGCQLLNPIKKPQTQP